MGDHKIGICLKCKHYPCGVSDSFDSVDACIWKEEKNMDRKTVDFIFCHDCNIL